MANVKLKIAIKNKILSRKFIECVIKSYNHHCYGILNIINWFNFL
jgi:hypothetical protein